MTNNGFERRYREHAEQYFRDPVLFLEDQWVVRNLPPEADIGPDSTIRLMDHQKVALRLMFDRDSIGRFHYQTMIWSAPKKSGKTEIEGGVGEWLLVVEPGVPELYSIGNDKEQSRTRAFTGIAQQAGYMGQPARNPVMARMLTARRDEITTVDGGFLKTVATDFAGEAGANPVASLWDELWGVDSETQRRLWDEFTPVPTRLNSIRFVATYAGFKGESELLWDLYERIVLKGKRIHDEYPIFVSKDGEGIAYWDEGSAAHRMPWQTDEYYKRERARNRPNAYLRLHENRWVDPETNFIESEDYDALETYVRTPEDDEAGHPQYITIDAAHKRDTLAVVVGEYLPSFGPGDADGFRRVVSVNIWRPTRAKMVIPEETAVPFIREHIASGANVKRIGFDPAHFETAGEMLRREFPGIEVESIAQTTDGLTNMGNALHEDIATRHLIVPVEDHDAEDTLRQHILNAKAIESPKGWRLSKGKAVNKIDAGAACATFCWLARTHGREDSQRGLGIYFGGMDGDDDE